MEEKSATGTDLRDLWATLVRRRWVIFTVAGLLFAAGATRTFTRQPIYRAASLVEIQRWGPDVLNFKDLLRNDVSWHAYNAFYETQYRILMSRAVARRAAVRLELDRHPLLPRREPGLLQRGLSALRGALPGGGSTAGLADPMDPYIDLLLGGLTVEPVKDSQLVEVGFVSPDPRFSAQVANAIADAYIEFTLSSHFDTTEEASDFLSRRVGELRDEVEILDGKLQSYREERQILPSSSSEEFTMKGVSDIHSLYLNARANRIEHEARWLASRESDPSSLANVVENPAVGRLQNEVNDLEIRRAELLRRFKPGWPEVEATTRKLEQARERLALQIDAIAKVALAADEAKYRASLGEEQRLEGLLEQQRSAAQRAGRDAIGHDMLQAEAERKRAVLNALLQRQNETAISSQLRDMGSGNARVVDRAFPPRAPFSPRPLIELSLALMIGLFLGIGSAFALEAWDNTLRAPEDVERVLGLPTLARIPAAPGDRPSGPAPASADVDLSSHRSPASVLAESFRDLRTALSLSAAGATPRLLALTSTRPGEGKSTIAINLATVLAQSGRKVLLVDSDLRRPRLHRALGVRNGVGLSTVLCGKASLGEAAQATPVPGLSLLPSGPVPPNPAELLDSPSFDALLAEIGDAGYDSAVLDSTPLLTVADGAIVSARAEGTLMVIEADRTTRDEARRALEKIRQGPAKILGVVLNNVVETASSYARYQYHHEPAEMPADEHSGGTREEAPGQPARRFGRRARS
jgi:capsular exopolysaccharide synthesis family protein